MIEIKPMLCLPIKRVEVSLYYNNPNLIAQKKEDGTRALIYFVDGKVILINRDLRDITYRYPETLELEKELKEYNSNLILDTEIKSIKGYDLAHLRDSQESRTRIMILAKMYPIKFFIFDVLKYGDELLLNKILKERLTYLEKIKDSGLIEIAKTYHNIIEAYEEAKRNGWEGIIIKNLNAIYEEGIRSINSIKLKLTDEAILKLDGYQEHSAGVCCLSGVHRVTCNIKPIAEKIKQKVDNKEDVFIEVNFLEVSKAGMFRQPVFHRLVGEA